MHGSQPIKVLLKYVKEIFYQQVRTPEFHSDQERVLLNIMVHLFETY